MMKLPGKILRNEKATTEDWNEFLAEAHRKSPSQTPRTFSSFRTKSGETSYEILAQSLTPGTNATVLDLACGDGHLAHSLLPRLGSQGRFLGIDMSEAELALARERVIDPRVSFQLAKAQALPIADASVDLVTCHMALMLMLPIEPVIQELGRVLKPAGKLAVVVVRRTNREATWQAVVEQSIGVFFERFPALKEVPTGDPRVLSVEGTRELLNAEFMDQMEIEFDLEVATTPEGLWDFMRDMYYVGMVPEAEQGAMRERLIALGLARRGDDGLVRFAYPMRKFVFTRK